MMRGLGIALILTGLLGAIWVLGGGDRLFAPRVVPSSAPVPAAPPVAAPAPAPAPAPPDPAAAAQAAAEAQTAAEQAIEAARPPAPAAPAEASPVPAAPVADPAPTTPQPADDPALTPEGYDPARVAALIAGSELSEAQKQALSSVLAAAKDQPELLRATLAQIRALLQ